MKEAAIIIGLVINEPNIEELDLSFNNLELQDMMVTQLIKVFSVCSVLKTYFLIDKHNIKST
jgi:Leucine-rich repeat (LRR) protein